MVVLRDLWSLLLPLELKNMNILSLLSMEQRQSNAVSASRTLSCSPEGFLRATELVARG